MNEEEKRKKVDCFMKKNGLGHHEARKLVELTEAKNNGTIDCNGQRQLDELMVQLELVLPGTC